MADIWNVICYPIIFVSVPFLAGAVSFSVLFFIYTIAAELAGSAMSSEEIGDIVANIDLSFLVVVSALLVFMIVWLKHRNEWKRNNFWRVSNSDVHGIVMCALVGVALSCFKNGFFHFTGLLPAYLDLIEVRFNTHIAFQILIMVILTPALNEIIFRGIVLRRLLRMSINFHLANVIQALLVASLSFSTFQGTYAFFGGIIFGLAYAKFKTIWAPIIMHILFSFGSVIIFNAQIHYALEISDTLTAVLTAVSAFIIGLFIYRVRKTGMPNDEGQIDVE